ncbi:hypothetical protein N5D52_23500 [Pseudomonas sp. GD03860]|uniref:hypothetical protein n=1 Tax=Pseudomonas TaxID=286 RepID=UPI0023632411|nr:MULTISPECIES: hypothetical protein [Pseudomonas]MDD2058954.1 hypothetical protein [Pseudomonas putida]MDH0639894.1 hypothetical protein [Pseudomonas sp. GD03860]
MQLNKREQAQIERRLVATLTDACETAKAQIIGFSWLTHVVDYARFPASLKVIWVFETQADQDRALAGGQDRTMVELTAMALQACGLTLKRVDTLVHFDCEQQCQRANGGDWSQRLARLYTPRG